MQHHEDEVDLGRNACQLLLEPDALRRARIEGVGGIFGVRIQSDEVHAAQLHRVPATLAEPGKLREVVG
jgi:hypothetical protein